jgi:hypothetical protein
MRDYTIGSVFILPRSRGASRSVRFSERARADAGARAARFRSGEHGTYSDPALAHVTASGDKMKQFRAIRGALILGP